MSLSKTLNHLLAKKQQLNDLNPLRLAVVGIGNELNSDDAAGVLAARALRRQMGERAEILILEGANAPENFTGPLRRFAPDLVILLDAVWMDAAPGTVAWIQWEEVDGMSASTHTLPPTVFGRFIQQELGAHVVMIGIQAASVEFDQPIHKDVKRAVRAVSRQMARLLV